MVPFLMSVVSIGNDLSASALTRALNSPNRRTNVCNIGFTGRDVITFIGIFFFFFVVSIYLSHFCLSLAIKPKFSVTGYYYFKVMVAIFRC